MPENTWERSICILPLPGCNASDHDTEKSKIFQDSMWSEPSRGGPLQSRKAYFFSVWGLLCEMNCPRASDITHFIVPPAHMHVRQHCNNYNLVKRQVALYSTFISHGTISTRFVTKKSLSKSVPANCGTHALIVYLRERWKKAIGAAKRRKCWVGGRICWIWVKLRNGV